jgi:beta-glucosidase
MTSFPRDFLWGVATAAYQIEGAADVDGRRESIWDRFSRTPGKVRNGDTGDVACDHYNRWPEDLALLSDLGIRAYRFSIAWPRVVPDGCGAPNQRGLDFYRRLVEGLRERGIAPFATLYHWDLPQALQDRGGWVNRDCAAWFAEYAATCFESLGDVVDRWITINEPWVVSVLGHGLGIKAPGHRDWREALVVGHHTLVAHGLAVRALRSSRPDSEVGITLDFTPADPASDDPRDVAAAARENGHKNRWFPEAVLRGRYPEDMVEWYEERLGPLDFVRDGDLALACEPTDFLGVNFYTRLRVADAPQDGVLERRVLPPTGPTTAMGWEVVPEALTELLVRLRHEYGDLRIYITENGAAYDDHRDGQPVIEDHERVEYLRIHLAAIERAIVAGVDVRGYFAWSLLDNFEWEEGYGKRFGLVYIDFASLERLPKRSALWYRDVITANGR